MTSIWAISDLHLDLADNRALIDATPCFPGAALLVAGDVAQSLAVFERGIAALAARFDRVVWAPGNHELRRLPGAAHEPVGVARYEALLALCRRHGVFTPEDAFPTWPTAGGVRTLVPLFLLYDHSFAPASVAEADAVAWAAAAGISTADTTQIDPAPFATLPDWCRSRCAATLDRLNALPGDGRAILVNHFPMHASQLRLKPPPAFAAFCGTRVVERWPVERWCDTIVFGHLHWPGDKRVGRVRHLEVSLGYPHEQSAVQRRRPFTPVA